MLSFRPQEKVYLSRPDLESSVRKQRVRIARNPKSVEYKVIVRGPAALPVWGVSGPTHSLGLHWYKVEPLLRCGQRNWKILVTTT